MKNISKYNYLFIGVGCFILIGLMSLTYSKFSYEQNLSGSVVTVKPAVKMTLYETLVAMDYTLDTNVDFSQGASSTNGQGLMMREGTQNDEYPIRYYRGNVSNNTVIYAGFCWLIVRTTETGGVKLIYNGEVNEDGSCNWYSKLSLLEDYDSNYINAYINQETSAFNPFAFSPVYVGYMYNDTNLFFDVDEFILDGIGYAEHLSDNSIIENGLDSETGRHTQNKTDSTIKGVIDAWYVANIKGKPEESLLEDTVWCNDRSIIDEEYNIDNFNSNGTIYFAAATRLLATVALPSLVCSRNVDKFTVDSANGNGDLDYPIGLLTADEMSLIGYDANWDSSYQYTYISIPDHKFWSMSPYTQSYEVASVFDAELDDNLLGYDADNPDPGVRPSISLNNSATISGGNGEFATPYRIS